SYPLRLYLWRSCNKLSAARAYVGPCPQIPPAIPAKQSLPFQHYRPCSATKSGPIGVGLPQISADGQAFSVMVHYEGIKSRFSAIECINPKQHIITAAHKSIDGY